MKNYRSLITLMFLCALLLIIGNTLVYSADNKDEGYLGIIISDLDESEKKISGIMHGVVITSIMENSPAEKCGLQKFDVIQTFNNQKIEDAEDLYDIVRDTKPETKVTITFIREGKKESTEVILGTRKTYENLYEYAYPLKNFFLMKMRSHLGIQIQELNADLGSYFGIEEGQGVLVLSVMEDSPAEDAGIIAGDVIVQIGKTKINNPEDVLDAVSEYDEGEKIDLTVIRHKKTISLKIQIKEDYEDIDIYKWHGYKPGIHFKNFEGRWLPGSFDSDIDRSRGRNFEPGNEQHFRKNIIRFRDKQIFLKDRIKNRIKESHKKTYII